MSGRGRPKGSKKKLTPSDARGTQRIDTIFKRIAREQTQEKVIRDSTVEDEVIILQTLDQVQRNSEIRRLIDSTKQTNFVITPAENPPVLERNLGVPLSFGGSSISTTFKFVNERVENANVVALNTNAQRRRINKPEDAHHLDKQIVIDTVLPQPDRPSDAQLLSSALSDGQTATVEMATLNLEQLIEQNPILADILGNPQINLLEAISSLLEQPPEQNVQTQDTVQNNTNVIVPVLERHLNFEAVERDLENQLDKSDLIFPMASQGQGQGESQPEINLPSVNTNPNAIPLTPSSINAQRLVDAMQEDELNASQGSVNSVSSQVRQQLFDRYVDELFASQPSQPGELEPYHVPFLPGNFYTPPSSQSQGVIDLDFDYVDEYLMRSTENALVETGVTGTITRPEQAIDLVKRLPIVNRYLALPAPSPPLVQREEEADRKPVRVRIRRPKGLSTLSAKHLKNRRRTRETTVKSGSVSFSTSSNRNMEILRQRLRRLVSRVVANAVDIDRRVNVVQESEKMDLTSHSQLPSQFDFE